MVPGQIGRYEIKGELGRGGMAAVYRAYDPRFKREVAVKVLPREFLHDPSFHARFAREAQTIAALEHPAIVPVYDYGEENDQPYLVMRLMTGGSLADRLANGPLSLAETASIFSRLAPALDRAHTLGIVHRDLKPGNILFDGDGNPYISDFGLAKLTQSNTQLSQTGVLGTPAYMSPEQARGDKVIDGRADLYALGAILFQMLTGRLPFEADTPMGLVFKHVTEPPPQLSAVRPDLPEACGEVITRAMAKAPDQRFATASALTSALTTAARGAPVTAPETTVLPTRSPSAQARTSTQSPETVARPASSPPARSKLPLVLGGLALGAVVLIAVAVVVVMLMNPLSPPAVPASTSVPTTAPTTEPAVVAETPKTAPTPTSTAEPALTPTPEAGAEEVSTVDAMPQVYVPAGEFIMGNNAGPTDQQPEHVVFLESFWIDQYEVTNAQYALCVASGRCTPPQRLDSITRPQYYGVAEFENFPVIYVSWFQAKDYCEWAGRRLPTEAEWEKAARGDDRRLYPWGNETPSVERLNFRASGFGDTVAGYSYVPNVSPLNVVDMAGNVSEWVADYYDPTYYSVSPKDNPTGPAQTGCPGGDCRVLRGGNWNGTAEEVTTTFRLFYGPSDSRDAFGIRCARTP